MTKWFKLFGVIPLWCVTVTYSPEYEEALEKRVAKRVFDDLQASLAKAKR